VIFLTLRTDKPEAEVGMYKDGKQLAYESWQAHRELSETIHKKIEGILNHASKYLTSQVFSNGAGKFTRKNSDKNFGGSSISLEQVQGIIVYKGPGSFTGLRIGMSVANSLAYSLNIPIVAKSGQNWIELGAKILAAGNPPAGRERIALPEYGQAPKTTKPRK